MCFLERGIGDGGKFASGYLDRLKEDRGPLARVLKVNVPNSTFGTPGTLVEYLEPIEDTRAGEVKHIHARYVGFAPESDYERVLVLLARNIQN